MRGPFTARRRRRRRRRRREAIARYDQVMRDALMRVSREALADRLVSNHAARTISIDIRADTRAFVAAMNRAAAVFRHHHGIAIWDLPQPSTERLWLRAYAADQHDAAHDFLDDVLEQTYTDLGLPYVPANITLGDN